jgi:hypothetical protein
MARSSACNAPGGCGVGVFDSGEIRIDIDETTMRARAPLPACPACGALPRPNVLMFNDYFWDETHAAAQTARFQAWLHSVSSRRLVVVECGAGTAVRTVRQTCEAVAGQLGGKLIRINVREPDVPSGHVGLPMGAKDALLAIDSLLSC